MGANQFTTNYYQARNMQEAFKEAQEDAEYEYGHQEGYSGHINSINGYKDLTNEFENSKIKLGKFIDNKLETINKRDCYGVCVEQPKPSAAKIKSKVNHEIVKGTSKWILYYVVTTGFIEVEKEVTCKRTKGEAVIEARKYTEKTGEKTYIHVEKRLEKGNARVATIEYKKDSKEKLGKYIFFGEAPN